MQTLINICHITSGPGAARAQTAVFGGKENDIQLWDLTTQGVMWKAKNVSNDKLSLRVPIYVTAVKYLGACVMLNNTTLSYIDEIEK